MNACTHCGKENRDQARFCGHCGKPFLTGSVKPKGRLGMWAKGLIAALLVAIVYGGLLWLTFGPQKKADLVMAMRDLEKNHAPTSNQDFCVRRAFQHAACTAHTKILIKSGSVIFL